MNKMIDIKDFREKGYLQEVNRQFLHPLGLALSVTINEDGSEYLNGILDYRDEPCGIIYDLENLDKNKIEDFKLKMDFIEKEFNRTIKSRIDKLGYGVEQLPKNIL